MKVPVEALDGAQEVIEKLRVEVAYWKKIASIYGEHGSWRCEYPDRYPWSPDCPCGWSEILKKLEPPQ